MDKMSNQGQGSGYFSYLDDILIYSKTEKEYCSNMQMSTSPMTQFWSTDSAPMWMAFTQSNMQMHKVMAEAVPCLQVGFALYKHLHISMSLVSKYSLHNLYTSH